MRPAHDVGSPVDNRSSGVDVARGPSAVHLAATFVHHRLRLSSTALTAPDASVPGSCATLSPESTDAKTMDENLYSLMGNDKSDHLVRVGDNRLVERSDA
jgi:hypothetical protein